MSTTTVVATDTTDASTETQPQGADEQDSPTTDSATGSAADEQDDVESDDEDDEPDPKDLAALVDYYKRKAGKNANEAKNLRSRAKTAEAELKTLKPKAEGFDAAEDAKRSDLEKAQIKIEELKAANEKLRKENGLAVVNARYDFPVRVLGLVTGDTAEELLESADELAAELGIQRKDKPGRRRPAATELAGGRDPGAEHKTTLADQITDAQQKGDWKLASALKAQQLFALRSK